MCAPHADVGGKQWRSTSVAALNCVWKHCVHKKLKRISNRKADAKITPAEKVVLTNVVKTRTFYVPPVLNH
jgi:hypothetical protein